MRRAVLIAGIVLSTLASSARAEEITGTILIARKLTKRSVTPSLPLYQRGPTVELGRGDDQDPLDFERSHVLVYLEGPASPAAPSSHAEPAILSQQGRQFVPDLVVIPAGGTVSFPNMDPIFHNVFSLSHAKEFDLGSYDKGETRSMSFPKPGIVSVYCHLHPNMSATIFVAPNRWYARSDRAGHFSLHDVPPGNYTIVAWHKAVGTFRQPVHVEAGTDAAVSFVLPLADLSAADKAKGAK